MKDYIAQYFKKAYEFINPEYARNMRMAKFEALLKSGELEGMCASEIHNLFGISKVSTEF
ncbi:Uncharacterised protein [uncultured archaeon]|nr:Uncharacterised protein [uncultured archaeon]